MIRLASSVAATKGAGQLTSAIPVQGVLFHDRMRGKVLQSIKPDLDKLEQAYRQAHPDVPIQAVAT